MSGKFKTGDVVSYTPANRWCREGTAIAMQRSVGQEIALWDTFWQGGGADQHRLTDDEIATAALVFNVDDYDELDRYRRESASQWERYAPSDRQLISSQHGLQKRWLIRKGASEDWPTKIENARSVVAERESALESAQRQLQWAREDLDRVVKGSTQEVTA